MIMNETVGRLICKSGDLIGNQYRVLDACSSGSFSNVYMCTDLKSQESVIVKVYKNRKYFTDSAVREIRLMKLLNKLDQDQMMFVQFLGSFAFQKHQCVVLERFGPSLYDAFAQRNFKPINLNALKIIIYKVCSALDVLHQNGIVHTDVKLENILLPIGFDGNNDFNIEVSAASDAPNCCNSGSEDCFTISGQDLETSALANGRNCEVSSSNNNNNKNIDIRLIDFGSLAMSDKWNKMMATTRQYRAPEILMGARWGAECDVWSLGCVLVELALGKVDFDADDDIEHLLLIQHMISPFPEWMQKETTSAELKKSFCGNLINPGVIPEDIRKDILSKPPLAQQLAFDEDLMDIALKMLNPNPFERPSMHKLLEHPFFESI